MIKNIIFFAIFISGGVDANVENCKIIKNGIYVLDDSYPRSGPGKMSGVLEKLSAKGLDREILGTTGQFSYAFTIRDGQVVVSKSLGNILDESYESTSSAVNANMDVSCGGTVKISFEFNKYYYPNYIKIGVIPKRNGKPLKRKLNIALQGRVLDDGNFIINKCSEKTMNYIFDEKKWGEWNYINNSSSLFGLCSNPQNSIFFNISPFVAGKKEWIIQ